jgi:hypothetical protein
MSDWIWAKLVWADREINDKWLKGYFETISGRCHRTDCRFCRWLCKKLDAIDPNHCKNAYLKDRIDNPDLPWI